VVRGKNQQKVIKFNLDGLNSTEIREKYRVAISEKVPSINTEMNESGTVESMCKKLKEGIKDAAETTLGFAPKQNSRDWFDEERRMAIEARNEARRQYLQRPTRAKEQEYRNHRREADKICKRKKRVPINERLQ
jgi:hypothetical protein